MRGNPGLEFIVLDFGTKRPRVRIPPLRHKNPKCPSWVLRVFAIRNDGKESAAAAANEGSVSPVVNEGGVSPVGSAEGKRPE